MAIDVAEGFGNVIYTAWEETYRGLMPDSILDKRSLEECIQRAKITPNNKLVALSGGKVVGVLGFLPQARNFVTDNDSGEIVALYVLKDYQKQGIGKALVKKSLEYIERPNVTLFVLKGNDNAIKFYKKMGFEFTGHELVQQIFDSKITELEMILKK
ncbi:MAG: GNAT family N-acetyltransferase [Ruminococcus sp.]|nr:GNAT family N-acetyltransferase [Ruminococcus sp.]